MPTPLSQLVETTRPRILLLGHPGTGKSAWAATLGAGTLFLDLEGGLHSCVTMRDGLEQHRLACDVEAFHEEGGKPNVPARLMKFLNDLAKQKPFPYKTLVLDSLSALCDASFKEALATSGTMNDTSNKQPDMSEWGTIKRRVNQVLWTLRDLPCGLVVIAHVMEEKGSAGRPKQTVAVSPKTLVNDVTRLFPETWYTDIVREKDEEGNALTRYEATTHGDGFVIARSNSNFPQKLDMSVPLVEHMTRLTKGDSQ